MADRAPKTRLRSRAWFDNPDNPGMTALYLERYMNFGLTLDELRGSGKPIIGIAQTGSDLSPCNRHHIELASRVRDGIRDAGGIPFEFPVHPIQETGKRPTAALDRNLTYLGLVEVLPDLGQEVEEGEKEGVEGVEPAVEAAWGGDVGEEAEVFGEGQGLVVLAAEL